MPVLFPRRNAIAWLSASLLLATIATTAQARDPFTVFDSKGKLVGSAMDFVNDETGAVIQVDVPFRVRNKRIVLPVDRNGYVLNDNYIELLFEQDNCTGQPYTETPRGAATHSVQIAGDRHTLYVADGAFRKIRVLSTLGYYISRPVCRSHNPTEHRAVQPLVRVLDLDDRFTPPFRIVASTEAVDLEAAP